ncbi:2-hydroxy-6-oxo-6-phenylhexa-2, 4-dienoatehydrolase [Methanoculleus chikugoensis]|jgi:pimeloyl-ACP methyl ester carboxylesterase|uniref:2-hydroxy-6-oxo-6-phenylhexa-2, 4-dienoatehydrolase n=2 Tax=Methanoculleus chikugoensis TaxID=118126 RepID=A0A1M4MP65_9EURY|nr:2-hydroxy-6-oxo-6-phenylhexa-2, 4-dienoatehydrolase [Methanoculleus chikugoensis]
MPMADVLFVLILLGIAVVGAAVAVRYRRDMRAGRERIERSGSRVVRTDYGSIAYARAGEGYPVLVVHGNAGGFDQGLLLADWTIGPGFQVIAPSRFGYPGSPMPPDPSVAMQADAYASLLDALAIEQAAVVGYSAGSASAIQFAVRHPERLSALVLVEPVAPGKGPVMPKPIFTVFFKSDFIYWATITFFQPIIGGPWAGVPPGKRLTPKDKADVRMLLSSLLPVSARVDGSAFDIYVSTPGLLNATESDYPFGRIGTPALVVSAVDDPLALHENARALVEKIPNARLQAVPGGGHMLLGHHEEVRQGIMEFLRSTVASPPQPR